MTAFHPTAGFPQSMSLSSLRRTATWIRDELDPLIAREGPDAMHPDDAMELGQMFQDLQIYKLDQATIATSRIHHAVQEISGKATRWPHKLADECDKVIDLWRNTYGSLQEIRVPLYQRGGRLFKVCTVSDLTREDLIARWTRESRLLVEDSRAYSHWQDECEPGQWWINSMFAFRDGIIDLKSTDGGICADRHNAYAVVLKENDEVEGSSAYSFTYRCRANDKGRYRLTSAHFKSRYPLRILRSHSLASLWAPRAGVRYDGLYKVIGWTLEPNRGNYQGLREALTWLVCEENTFQHLRPYLMSSPLRQLPVKWIQVRFEREPDQMPMETVLLSPTSEDVDDYREYKRLRRLQREKLRHQATTTHTGHSTTTSAEPEKKTTGELTTRVSTTFSDGKITLPPELTSSPRVRSSIERFASSSPSKARQDSTSTAPRQLQTTPTIGSILKGAPERLQKMGRGIQLPEPAQEAAFEEGNAPSKRVASKGKTAASHHGRTARPARVDRGSSR